MRKVRWGVLSTAKIAREKVIPAMQKGEYCEISAIASRNLKLAEKTAKELKIAKAYGSYAELLDDPDIEAIYNPLPNHLHVSWSIKSLRAGKHVLCEKPIAWSSNEAKKLVAAFKKNPHLKIMEAFMYRFHPQWQFAKQLVEQGKIRRLRTIHSFFSYFNDEAENIRNIKKMGGGGLMDIGCYCISLSRFVFNNEPQQVCGIMEFDPQFKTDRLTSGVLDFGNGTATFTCSTQLSGYQRVNIFGTDGRIEIVIPFNAPEHKPCKIFHQYDEEVEEILFNTCNQYTIQGDLFSQAVINDIAVPTPIEDAVKNMEIVEAIIRSAKSKNWIKC